MLARPRPRHDDAEARLRLIEDEAELRDLVATYGYLCDHRRWDELVALGLRHLTCNVAVRVAPDGVHASAVAYYQLGATRGHGDDLERGTHEGTFVFDFVRTDQGWRFTRQVVASDNASNPLFSSP